MFSHEAKIAQAYVWEESSFSVSLSFDTMIDEFYSEKYDRLTSL